MLSVPQLPAPVYPLLLPATIALRSDTEWCASLPEEWCPLTPVGSPEGSIIALPAKSAWLKIDPSLITFDGPYQPLPRDVAAINDLGAWMVDHNLWDDQQRIIVHDIDRCRYCHPMELTIRKGLAFIEIYPPNYKDTPRSKIERQKLVPKAEGRVIPGLLAAYRPGPLIWGL